VFRHYRVVIGLLLVFPLPILGNMNNNNDYIQIHSWPKQTFSEPVSLSWEYTMVRFNGALNPYCPCEGDKEIIHVKKDLSQINLVNQSSTVLQEYIDYFHENVSGELPSFNHNSLVDLEALPLIYPTHIVFTNNSKANALEFLTEKQPFENRSEYLTVTRKIENGNYTQRIVYSYNPYYRIQTSIDVQTGILISLYLDEGFFSLSGGFSHLLLLELKTPHLLQLKNQTNTFRSNNSSIDGSSNEDTRFVVFPFFISGIIVLFIIKTKKRLDLINS
jgi:hypothetical protein